MIIKFCGMRRQEDLNVASELGAKMCGFILHPQSPRYISPPQAGKLSSCGMERVGVFLSANRNDIAEQASLARLDWIQLHGGQDPALARNLGPGRIIRVLWPERYESVTAMRTHAWELAASCALFLLDAGHAGGGSGKTLSWRELAALDLPKPWLLAGGIAAENAGKALRQCSPCGLDVNSGVETAPGIKDHMKMRLLMQAVNSFTELEQ